LGVILGDNKLFYSNMNFSKNNRKATTFFEYLLTHYRGWFATIFLLPLSVVYNLWFYTRNKIVFWVSTAPKKHHQRVQKIIAQIDEWRHSGAREPLCTARSGWLTMSELVPLYKKYSKNIKIDLHDIIELNLEKQTVRVQPLVNMGQITALLNPLGWTLPVVPELDDLTVGGLINGFGVESSSHKYGLFQHICISLDIVTAEGKLVHCSENENAELFYSVPWSHGTLGFLVAAELKIIPAKRYVRLQYEPLYSLDDLVTRFEQESRNLNNDFVELLQYSSDTGVLMTGKMTDRPSRDGQVNRLGLWFKPWFYKHVQSFLTHHKTAVEYIPLRSYYHRHTRSFFWEMEEIIPFGNHPIYRFLLGWALPPRIALLKFFETETTQQLREKYHVVQDMLMPMAKLKESLLYFDKHYQLYPLWLCPMAVKNNPQNIGFIHPYPKSPTETDELFVDIGAYGTPKAPGFDGNEALKKLEKFVIENNGYQALYARTLMSREQFRTMFDHTFYDILRDKLPYCKQAFPEVYDKVGGKARVSGVEYKRNSELPTPARAETPVQQRQ
jgi:delta24-sterol reductase